MGHRRGIAKPRFSRSNETMLNAAVTEDGRFARTAHMKLSPIKEMELAASRIPGVVSLAQGIPSFDTPEPIKAFVQQKVAEGACAKYSLTPGLPQLRELIAESLLREGMHYDPESEIIVTCGSIEGIAATLLTLTQPGDEVILPTPSYASYQEVVRLAGCTPRFAVLREDCFKCEVFFCGKRFALTCRVLKVIVVTERREQECVGALRGSSQRKQCKRHGVKKFHGSTFPFRW